MAVDTRDLILETIVSYNRRVESATLAKEGTQRGRPREFDVDAALDQAIRVFCARGYHASSITDLTEAMNLTSGSVYKAFKDKRAVFIAALERYHDLRVRMLRQRLDEERGGLNRVRAALTYYAELCHGPTGLNGCLVVGGAAELATLDPAVAEKVNNALSRNEGILSGLIGECQDEGSVSPDLDRGATARLMLCVIVGMRVIGRTGKSREEMLSLVDIAMKTLA